MKHLVTSIVAVSAVALSLLSAHSQTKAKPADLCVKPAAGPIAANPQSQQSSTSNKAAPQIEIARVGRAAPNFEANAYADGGFKPIKLSDYKGKWVVLCFYPGDFTFV